MNNHNYEMATPINSLQNEQHNTNINNLVRNVENNIETLNNTSNVPSSLPANLTYQPRIMTEPQQRQHLNTNLNQQIPNFVQPQQYNVNNNNDVKSYVPDNKNSWYKELLVNSKE